MFQLKQIGVAILLCAAVGVAQAQSQPNMKCQRINTTETGTFDTNTLTAEGTTRSGPLKGSFTFTGVLDSVTPIVDGVTDLGGLLPGLNLPDVGVLQNATPPAASASYRGSSTFTTSRGTLSTLDIGAYEVGPGRGVQLSRVLSGTGNMQNATGYLYFTSSSTDGTHFTSQVTGQICQPRTTGSSSSGG